MAKFLNTLCADEIREYEGRTVHKLIKELVWEKKPGIQIIIPVGFETDLASIPRIPLVYTIWGDRAHRETVLHDYAYRIDSGIEKTDADWMFREAMIGQGNSWFIYQPMWLAVRFGGSSSYHRMKIMDNFNLGSK